MGRIVGVTERTLGATEGTEATERSAEVTQRAPEATEGTLGKTPWSDEFPTPQFPTLW